MFDYFLQKGYSLFMEKNEKYIFEIKNYGANGEGVAVCEDGKIAFIPYTLVGEKVVSCVKSVKKSFIECLPESVNKASSYRAVPKCPYFERCGGCQLQHSDYRHSLKIKQEIVQNAISKIGSLNQNVLPVIESAVYYGYRNKISCKFNCETKKLSLCDVDNNLIDIEDCVIVEAWCKKLIKITNDFVKRFNLSIYNSKTNKGLLKQLIARKVGKTLLVTIVVNGKELLNFEDYFSALLTEFESVGLSININTKANNYLPSNKFIHLCGEENIELCEFGVKYTINNACFMQVNTYIKTKIYEQILDEVKGYDLCLDCYSGAGLLTALVSKQVGRAIGVEIIKEATIEADKMKVNNNILNMENICGDSSVVVEGLKQEIKNNKTVIILDPPRKGCDKKLLQTLNEVVPQKIIYVSCDPATLARDLKILCASENSKYKINFIRPYDMFPQTKHIETVVVLESIKQ